MTVDSRLEQDGPGKAAFDDRHRLRVAPTTLSSEPGLNETGDHRSLGTSSSSESRIEIKGGLSEALLLDADPEVRNDDLLISCLANRSKD